MGKKGGISISLMIGLLIAIFVGIVIITVIIPIMSRGQSQALSHGKKDDLAGSSEEILNKARQNCQIGSYDSAIEYYTEYIRVREYHPDFDRSIISEKERCENEQLIDVI